MTDGDRDEGIRGGMRRVVGGALDATVGRVSHTVGGVALDATSATAEQVIEELEPYLIEQAIPRIVEGITPYLTESVVPEILTGIQDHLIDVTIPEVVDGVTEHLVETTVPQVVEGVTPRLVEDLLPRLLSDLRPYLEAELAPHLVDGLLPHLSGTVAPELLDALMPRIQSEVAPQLVDALMPKIEAELAPRLVDALMPKIQAEVAPALVDALMPKIQGEVAPQLLDSLMPRIQDEVAPHLVDALMPKIEHEVAPRLIEALMPRIEQEVAPQLVDALMPKIRAEVVPTILEDIVDDPRVRDLIREQSAGLFLDALELLRENLADADDVGERLGRRLVRRPPRVQPESSVTLVLDAVGGGDRAVDVRSSNRALAAQRFAWRDAPMPPAPPGREFAHAGVVTRVVSFAIDATVVGWLIAQGVTAALSVLESIFGDIPTWASLAVTSVGVALVPLYMAVCWTWTGRTLGSWLAGTRVCTPKGRNPGFIRSLVRAYLLVFALPIFVVTGVVSLFDRKRRPWIDELLHTEVRYVVPENQQHRYLREAIHRHRAEAAAATAAADLVADGGSVSDPDGPAPVA